MLFTDTTAIRDFYDYREAFVENPSLELDLSDKDEAMLKVALEEKGYKFNNHITFSVGEDIAVSYSDGKLYIGTKIKKGCW